nr:PREDICTED: uncharacterized protein LOC106701722 [Bos mutus]
METEDKATVTFQQLLAALVEKGGVQPLLGHSDPPVPCSDNKALTSVYTPHKYSCFSFLTPAACTTEGTGPQRPPQDVVPLAALSPRPPYLMPGHQLPSTRNYYTPTQTFTVISATKQMRVLSSSRHVSLRTV